MKNTIKDFGSSFTPFVAWALSRRPPPPFTTNLHSVIKGDRQIHIQKIDPMSGYTDVLNCP